MEWCSYDDFDKIVDYLMHNKAVLMETDTVLGLFSKNEDLLYSLKNRPKQKKIVLLVESIKQIPDPNEELKRLAESFWPGQLTLIYNHISYRIPNHKEVLKVLPLVHSVYCTSANISGEEPFRNSKEAFEKFQRNPASNDLLVVKGVSYTPKPSTIYDVDTHQIIRQGAITLEQIQQSLNSIKE